MHTALVKKWGKTNVDFLFYYYLKRIFNSDPSE